MHAALQTTDLDEFRVRCELLTLLVHEGRMSFIDAIDAAQTTATAFGVVDEFGQDEVQQLIARAFAGVPR